MPCIEEKLPDDRLRVIAIGTLDEEHVRKRSRVAREGEAVGIATAPFALTRIRKPKPRVPDEIERDVGRGEIFFECRSVAGPRREPLTEHEGVIAQTQRKRRKVGCVVHRCFTPSGTT